MELISHQLRLNDIPLAHHLDYQIFFLFLVKVERFFTLYDRTTVLCGFTCSGKLLSVGETKQSSAVFLRLSRGYGRFDEENTEHHNGVVSICCC